MDSRYIFKINLLICEDIENISLQSEIEEEIEKLINKLSVELKCNIENVSVELTDLEKNNNYGKCVKCESWTSDYTKNNCVREFSNGAILNNCWYCDLCLPKKHKNHFFHS